MKIRYGVLSFLIVCLAGCGNKPPQCSDEKTIELVKRIFQQSLAKKLNEPVNEGGFLEKMTKDQIEKLKQDIKLVVSTIRTSASDEKAGKVACDAVLEAEFPHAAKDPIKRLIVPGALMSDPIPVPKDLERLVFLNVRLHDTGTRDLKVNGLVVSTEIQYTSQMTDDKKEHLVEMRGFKGVVDLVSALGSMGVFKPVSATTTTNDFKATATPSAEAEIAAAKVAPKRNVSGVTLQAFECGDTCQLKYVDANGNSQTAICTDTKGCRSWAERTREFLPLIGAKADLVIGKKYIPEGGVTMDNVEGIILADVDPLSSSK